MKVCNIASGSRGNMTYLETNNGKFLIDAGVSIIHAHACLDINLEDIDGIFITHEHDDHVKFLDTVAKKTKAVIYIAKESYNNLRKEVKDRLVGCKIAYIEGESVYKIKDISLYTFNMSHDAASTFGFIIDDGKSKFGYFTDTGIFPTRYKQYLTGLDILMIEANHNIEMLQNSNRPYYLINRILSPNGHMSNQACYELLHEVLDDTNKYVLLSHISRDCNSYECLNDEIISRLDGKYQLIVTNQYEPTIVIEV